MSSIARYPRSHGGANRHHRPEGGRGDRLPTQLPRPSRLGTNAPACGRRGVPGSRDYVDACMPGRDSENIAPSSQGLKPPT